MGKKTGILEMTADQRQQLETWVRGKTTPQRVVFRAQICLLAADGLPVTDIAQRTGTSRPTVLVWKKRFEEHGPGGLLKDAPRRPGPRKLDEATTEAIIDTTLNATPPDSEHWTTRGLAKLLGVSNATVARIWKSHGIKPKKKKLRKPAKHKHGEEKGSELRAVYLDPPVYALLVTAESSPASRVSRDGDFDSSVKGYPDEMPEKCKVILETIRQLRWFTVNPKYFTRRHPREAPLHEEIPMKWKERIEAWFAAVAFAEQGEYETARQVAASPIREVGKVPRILPSLSTTFAAAAFAEENCPEEALEILSGSRRRNSFLEGVGLTGVRVRYGLAQVKPTFAEVVGLAGARFQVLTMQL